MATDEIRISQNTGDIAPIGVAPFLFSGTGCRRDSASELFAHYAEVEFSDDDRLVKAVRQIPESRYGIPIDIETDNITIFCSTADNVFGRSSKKAAA